jgi:hypothetical protein
VTDPETLTFIVITMDEARSLERNGNGKKITIGWKTQAERPTLDALAARQARSRHASMYRTEILLGGESNPGGEDTRINADNRVDN